MRNEEINSRDSYILSLTPSEHEHHLASRQAAEALGLARISLSPNEGQILSLLLELHGARKCVEVGTLTGLSAQYMFAALPAGGELWTLEKSPEHARAAAEIFSKLDQSQKKIHLVVGDAREKLPQIASEGPFDAIFIDGNKAAYGDYLAWAEAHLRKGGLILADNIFLSGTVWGEASAQKFSEKQIQIMRQFNLRLADTSLYRSAVLPTAEGLFVACKLF